MSKLLNSFRKVPSPVNRAKLQAYLDRHPMAVCCALPADIEFLRFHGFKI